MQSEAVAQAIEFAAKAHGRQCRKGTYVPYLVHPLGVVQILVEHGINDEDLLIAAMLHDTVEDAHVTYDQIRHCFGARVAVIVESLSEPDKSLPWETRKLHTIEYLKAAPQDIALAACADKLDNIRSLRRDHARHGEVVWNRFNRPKEKQAWYYQALAGAFAARQDGAPAGDLFREFVAEVRATFGKE